MAALALGACSNGDSDLTDSAAPPRTLEAGTSSADASAAKNLDAGTLLDASASSALGGDAQTSACNVPPDCLPVRSTALDLSPCCSEATRCGFAYVSSPVLDRDGFYATLGVAPGTACVPDTKLFHSGPTGESQRVPREDGGQVLISTDCPTAFITSLPFRGCCLPTNECAVSTHPIEGELKVLAAGADLPFTHLECVKSEELNAQFRASPLAGFGRLTSLTASCDYASLDRTLPPPSP
jgi:hypothetical protein